MFSSLAAYLFGNTSGDTETPSTSEGIAAVPNSNNLENLDPENDVKLKVVPVEVEEEDQEEWLIVDKDGKLFWLYKNCLFSNYLNK